MGHFGNSLRDRGHGYRHGCHRVHCQNYHLDERGNCLRRDALGSCLSEQGHQQRNRLRPNCLYHPCYPQGVVDLPMRCGLRRPCCLRGAVGRMKVRVEDRVLDCYLCSSGMPCVS